MNLFAFLQTRASGLAGLTIGTGAILAAVIGFFRLLSDPEYLSQLFVATVHAESHALTAADINVYSQLAAAVVTIVGATVVSLLLSYFGLSATAQGANASDAAKASASTPQTKEITK